ncbi:VanZ family protein [Blastococcus sp. TF02A-35]|uniref:VanZ family protein n=1 Tax=Blastococcus sp. TF02A-35 TaxID=2559612 RepID=UPI001073F19C|nr:VanZ family protein [Blastococcus sp. TF02A_35]TFV53690.1 VanZ family protein [Blastococcus sp. TF02A_35]
MTAQPGSPLVMGRRGAAVALVAYLALLASLTLGASPGAVFAVGAREVGRIDGLQWVDSGDVERAANVLVFVPVGLLLCFALPRVPRLLVWLLCVAVSAAVEAAQVFLPGRQPTPVDVVTNSTGAAVGVVAAVVLTWAARWWARRRQRVRQQ